MLDIVFTLPVAGFDGDRTSDIENLLPDFLTLDTRYPTFHTRHLQLATR